MKKLGKGRERANGKGRHSSVMGEHGEDGMFNFRDRALRLKIGTHILIISSK